LRFSMNAPTALHGPGVWLISSSLGYALSLSPDR
jgi:hypothetical protein